MANPGFLWAVFLVAIIALVGLIKFHDFYNKLIDKIFPIPPSLQDVFDGRRPTLNEIFKAFWLLLIAAVIFCIFVLLVFVYQ
jgi:hypothetical protein